MAYAHIEGLDEELRESISPDGWDWLISALDPFHDVSHKLAGYPDLAGGSSVVLEITRTVSVSGSQLSNGFMHCFMCPFSAGSGSLVGQATAAASVLTTSNVAWNTYNPLSQPIGDGITPNALAGLGTSNTGASQFNSGDLVISTGNITATNSALGGGSATISNPVGAAFMPAILLPPNVATGTILRHGITAPHRVIGCGFEVTNNTAPLYKSGNVVVYEVPSNPTTVNFWSSAAAQSGSFPTELSSLLFPTSNTVVQGPPTTIAQAMLLPGSRQWSAEEGSYNIVKFRSLDNPVSSTNDVQASLMVMQQCNVNYTAAVGVLPNSTLFVDTPNTVLYICPGQVFVYPTNGSGAWYTGLDISNSSFQVTAKWYLEVFPNVYFDQTLIPTITPSARFDPVALQVYAQVASVMPCAVPVRDNFIGLIGSAIGGIAKGVGAIVKGVKAKKEAAKIPYEEPWSFGGKTAISNNKLSDYSAKMHNWLNKNTGDMNAASFSKAVGKSMFDDVWYESKNRALLGEPEFHGVPTSIEDMANAYTLVLGSPSANSKWYSESEWPQAVQPQISHSPVNGNGKMMNHACNCGSGGTYGTGNRSMLPFNYGQPAETHDLIASAVHRGVSSAMTRANPVQKTVSYEEYEPEASEAVKAKRRKARARRREYIAACKASNAVPWTGTGSIKSKAP